jgi:hypothetical protein
VETTQQLVSLLDTQLVDQSFKVELPPLLSRTLLVDQQLDSRQLHRLLALAEAHTTQFHDKQFWDTL